jgi:hypothetical protein
LLVRVCGHSDANRMPTEKRLDAMTDCRDTMVISRVQSLLHAVRDSAFQIVMGVSKTAFHSRRASLSQSLSAPNSIALLNQSLDPLVRGRGTVSGGST